jgi:fatty-acyl-CoA synthase
MTETSPVSYMIKPSDSDIKKTTTVGTIMPHVETKIVD